MVRASRVGGTGSAGVSSKRHECFGKRGSACSAGEPPGLRARRTGWRAARIGCAGAFRLHGPPVRAGSPHGRAAGRRSGPRAVQQLRRRAADPAGGPPPPRPPPPDPPPPPPPPPPAPPPSPPPPP